MEAIELLRSRKGTIAEAVDDLRRVVQAVYCRSRQVERLADVTGPQAWLLAVLADSGPVTVSELARRMYVGRTPIIKIVDRLENRGLVSRTRSASDRKAIRVVLTHRGMKLAEHIPTATQDQILRGLEQLRERDLKSVSKALKVLAVMLGVNRMTPRLLFSPVGSVTARKEGLLRPAKARAPAIPLRGTRSPD